MADLGTDFAFEPDDDGLLDLDPSFRTVSGRANLVAAVARRLAAPFLFYDSTYGKDLRAELGESLTTARLARLRAAIAAQARRDERVRSAGVTVTFNDATRAMTVRIALTDDDGPFELVLEVTAAAVKLLEVSA
jgi:hypothetical protein